MKNHAHKAYLPFRHLHRAAVANGMSVRMHIFEGGETVIVSRGQDVLCRITREYGDGDSASAAAAAWLVERKYLTLSDIENASTD